MEKPPDSGYYGDFLRMDVPVTGWIIYGSKIIFYVLKWRDSLTRLWMAANNFNE